MPAKKNSRKPARKPAARGKAARTNTPRKSTPAKSPKAAKTPNRREPARPAPKAAAATSADGLRLKSAAPSLTVNAIDKSLAWYCDVLGFSVKERWEDGGRLLGAEISAGDVTFYIGQDDWQKGKHRTKGVGFRMYCSTTQDIDALAEQVKARGGQLLEEPHDESWGGRAFAVVDPDGFKITFSNS